MLPYGRQDINQEDVDSVVEVLRSNYLTQGPCVPAFEKIVAEKVGAKYAVAVNSATSALHIACLALELGPGDRLWTSPITFVASANCGLYCGATVDFVDIDHHTFNIDVELLERKLIDAEHRGELPKVVVAVDMCGQSANLRRMRELANYYGFSIIEDASHAIGARYKGDYVGNGAYSDITVFSFHPVKIVTTAEGGVAVTQSALYAERMGRLRSHGITRNQEDMVGESHGPWYYEQIELGFNYRMTEMQAALGISQMNRLDEFVQARTRLAARYDDLLQGTTLLRPYQEPDTDSSWHLYVVQLEDANNHKPVFENLRRTGIGVNLHYIPVHLQPYYSSLGFKKGDYQIAEDYYSRSISIPLFATMSDSEQDFVLSALNDSLAMCGEAMHPSWKLAS